MEVKKIRSLEDGKKGVALTSQLPSFPASCHSGFTLLEVIVAISILSICLVLVMQLFASGLRASRTSCDYTRAIVHAKDKMGEVMETSSSDLNSDSLVQGSGEFKDGFKWETEVQPFRDIEDTPYKLYKLLVKVKWNDGQKNDRAIELVTLKTVSTESVQ
ncbi:MAG: type II secretion system protein [Nitrospirae bacterium]|nr:type II secretion system protein [Nitrospirota bacterium]